eukprot:7622357-Pyramimonas_sp.AAC.1
MLELQRSSNIARSSMLGLPGSSNMVCSSSVGVRALTCYRRAPMSELPGSSKIPSSNGALT